MEDHDPIDLFTRWFRDAETHEPADPNAVALATADDRGRPSVRMVLLKGHDPDGFVFYTNMESRKGAQLDANPHAALCFHWKSLKRQVRVEGPVARVSDAEADAYFASRPRQSRIGAWASHQSRPLESRFALEKRVARVAAEYGLGEIPRPPFWTGCRLRPTLIEFWHDRPYRLHDRIVYHRNDQGGWTWERLYP